MQTALFAILLAFSAYALSDEPDVFRNQTVGFAVTKPGGWHFATVEQNLNSLKSVQLDNKEFKAMMVKYATVPFLVMTKHKEPYHDLNPSFKVNIQPLGPFKGKDVRTILSAILSQYQNVLKDFKLVQPPTSVSISGVASAYTRMNFTMEVDGVGAFPTAAELWIVPQGDFYFLVGAGTRQDERTGSRKEIESIVNTIVITQ